MEMNLTYWWEIILKLVVATVCGGIIGYQRETFERPAGFRTHILVCVGSAIYMLVSVTVAGNSFDPSRIAAQVASGMGFLGAGTIIKQGSFVRGLTTAASLWTIAGIGLAIGFGGTLLGVALLGTMVVFLSLTVLRRFEDRLETKRQSFYLEITLNNARLQVEWISELLRKQHIIIEDINVENTNQDISVIILEGRTPSTEVLEGVIATLLNNENIKGVHAKRR